jgi:hypothetical protein
MAGSYSRPRITAEILVKEKQVSPVWIAPEPFQVAERFAAVSMMHWFISPPN